MKKVGELSRNISQSVSPIAEQVGSNITSFTQYATEKIWASPDVTNLPLEFTSLENKIAFVKDFLKEFSKMGKHLIAVDSLFDYDSAKNQVQGIASNIGVKFMALASYGMNKENPTETEDRSSYLSLYQKLGRASIQESENVGLDIGLGNSLFKFGSIEENIGEYKKKQDTELLSRMVNNAEVYSNTKFENVIKANKHVHKLRLALDSAKASYKQISVEEKRRLAQDSISAQEKELEIKVTGSIREMRNLVQSPDLISLLIESASAMNEFYASSSSLLEDLKPELSSQPYR
ncbi:hypothetical protein AYI68_g7690 [Smittium mucronatum]|uniref:BAR domain-containing protein n=1 Tax=Smittium mucronatum TaxID=133383 RepID=A0A1R0GMY7_9FUNG|nr:hypothetical protein AYI68_g7690 [Smittium mucronatum]